MSRLTLPADRARAAQLVALVLAVVLIAATAVLALRAQSLGDDPALDNRALLDEDLGREVTTAVSRGLVQVLSYDWNQPDLSRAAADQVLSGQARTEYDTLFASLQERAPDQQLVLSTEVQVVGLQTLDEDAATMLVFLDQSSSRAEDDEASVSAAQIMVEAERDDGGAWLITGLRPL